MPARRPAHLEGMAPPQSLSLELREAFEKRDLVIVPAGYYYPVPTEAELRDSFESAEETPFANSSVFDRDHTKFR